MSNQICTLHEIKNTLTIDQVYLFYEKCIKKDLEKQKIDAVTLANALVYASPSYDTAGARKKQQMWDKFMNALDWDKITKVPDKPDPVALSSVFGVLGVPSTGKKIKKKGDS